MKPPTNKHALRSASRRELLKLLPLVTLGAFAIPKFQEPLLKKGLAFNDWMSDKFFRSHHLAPNFGDAALAPLDRFYVNTFDVDDPEIDLDHWSLTVSGQVQKPGNYTLESIRSLPKFRQNTRHICVEGWDVIGSFGGAKLTDFLTMVGADPHAKFISVECADSYYESADMATALHPQSLLCYEMYDQPLTREHGAPLRLRMPTKIGYKQAKYITSLTVTNVLSKIGYWEDQGYSEFYSI
jgi:DMSO/TMAO reductase YedYZ molybdopterin-dependent catalytic subunit